MVRIKGLRGAVFAAAIVCAAPAVALASDYIVVRSSDPAIAKAQAFKAGERVALGAGETLTVITDTGEVLTFDGSSAGVTLPRRAAPGDVSRFAALRALIARPPKRRSFGALRDADVCPDPETLTVIEDILLAEEDGCRAEATRALEVYLANAEAPAPEAPADAPVDAAPADAAP